jgi:hypothetical protein
MKLSKALVFSIATLVAAFSSASSAATLTCKVQQNYTVMMPDVLVATCDSEGYAIKIEGVGIGLQGALWTGLALTCPGVDDPSGQWIGAKLDYDFIAGNDVGLYFNKAKKAVCALGTINAGSLGAAASYSNMTIVKLKK